MRILAATAVGLIGVIAVWMNRPGGDVSTVLGTGRASGYHVVVITLDTTRADHLGCYGNQGASTPVLDRLARKGIRFADAVSSIPITLPSHSSMFTGLDPPRHGVRHNGEYILSDDQVTLAERLKEQGYATAGFVSSFVLDPRFGIAQGFDTYDAEVNETTEDLFGGMENERFADTVTTRAIEWLGRRPKDRPFFLWVHYYDPHFPYNPPTPFQARFSSAPYDGEIAFMDSQIGRLVEALETEGLTERSLLVVQADHGESHGEHNEDTHSRTIYEATQHVPLIVWSPSLIRRGLVVDGAAVGIVDLFPSVLDLLGLSLPDGLDGMPWRLAVGRPDRMLYLETLATYFIHGWSPLHALRRHHDKFIFAPQPEYYDLTHDPGERNNLYGSRSARVQAALAELEPALAAKLKDSPTASAVAASAVKLDPSARARLESLGYLSSEAPPSPDGPLPDPKEMLPTLEALKLVKHLTKTGRHDEALAKARAASRDNPRDWGLLKQIGVIYLSKNEPDNAIEPFRQCLAIRPNPNVMLLLAQIMIPKGQFEEATALLDEADRLEPDNGAVVIARGDMKAFQNRPREAIELYQQAVRIDPFRAKKLAEQRMAGIQRMLGHTP